MSQSALLLSPSVTEGIATDNVNLLLPVLKAGVQGQGPAHGSEALFWIVGFLLCPHMGSPAI